MTQPTEAVGAANDEPVIAAEPTIEDRLTSAIELEPAEEGDEPNPDAGAEPELTEEDLAEEGEAEDPPIAAPASWKDEEKAIFADLPPDVQKVVARREADREKFIQQKSQEAAQTRQAVTQEAVQAIQGINQQHAQALQALLPQIPEKPTNQQMADEPWTYAPLMDAYENAVAQHQWVQQRLQGLSQQAQMAEQTLNQQRQQETAAVLTEKFPEFLDAAKSAEIKQELASTAAALGIPAEMTTDLHHIEILALREANGWRKDAEKYRALVGKQMEKVRAAKGLPKVSRPGVPQGKGAVANARYTADRQAMKGGDMDAAARAISRFL